MFSTIKKLSLTIIVFNLLMLQSLMADMMFYYSAAVLPSIVSSQNQVQLPIADAGEDKTTIVNQAVTIIGSGTDNDGIIVSYEWKKGSELLSTEATLSYTPTVVAIDTLTLTVTDDDDNNDTDTMTVTVTDGTAPVITVTGSNPLTIEQDSTYVDEGATATDDVDDTVIVTTTGSVNTSIVGEYIITYTAEDSAGNHAVPKTRTVHVVDVTPPVITITGDTTLLVEQGSTYTDAGATATDNVDTTVTVTSSGSVDTNTVGEYTITYNAVDAAGNDAVSVERTVQVVDITSPVFTSSATVSVDENQHSAITLVATDTNTIIYSISGGDANDFDIDTASGIVTFKIAPDYESGKTSYTFTATATDSASNTTDQSVTITINDLSDTPLTLADTYLTVVENAEEGTIVGSVTIINTGDTEITGFILTGSGEENFSIDINGEITVALGANLDYETISSYTLSSSATSSTENSATVTVTIAVSDVIDEGPLTASDFNMTLDVNESNTISNWKILSSARGSALTATVMTQGNYGEFFIVDDLLEYRKTTENTETNATDSGVLEISDGEDTIQVTVTINLLFWEQISSEGGYHTMAIKSDGTLWGWGSNSQGQLGDGTTIDRLTATQESSYSTDWISVKAGPIHTVAIKNDGTLWAWGNNSLGQLGDGSYEDSLIPVQEQSASTTWMNITNGRYHTLAIKSDGTLWAWGSNSDGQLGNGSTDNSSVPVQESTHSIDWVSISASQYRSSATKNDGTLWYWGKYYGLFGSDQTSPTQEGTAAIDWSDVSVGSDYTVAIKNDGTIWSWGRNDFGQLGDGTASNSYNTPVQECSASEECSPSVNWSSVHAGSQYTVAIKNDGTLWAWGYNKYGQLGNGETNQYGTYIPTQEIHKMTDWSSVSASINHTVAIKNHGTLWSWGRNHYGELCNGTKDNDTVPTQEGSASTEWVSIDTTEGDKTLAIKNDGTLWAWGYNPVGTDVPSDRYVPVQVQESSTAYWVMITGGYNYMAAIKADETLWSWGSNSDGQLGDGTTDTATSPVQESINASDWLMISGGGTYSAGQHTAAIKNNGTLWAWGANSYGELGNGSDIDSLIPVQEQSASTWISVSVMGASTVAIKSDGTLWSWGRIDVQSPAVRPTPLQEGTYATDWVSVDLDSHSYAHNAIVLKSDGTLWSWDRGTGDTHLPIQESSHSTWTKFSQGSLYTVAIKNDGTLWSWGKNDYGQLGDGTTTDKLTPIQEISHATDWVSVSAGEQHTIALKNDGSVWAWGKNDHGQLGTTIATPRKAQMREDSSELPPLEVQASCKAYLDTGTSVGDGIYTIDPDGNGVLAPFDVYCDMTTDGGGWMYWGHYNQNSNGNGFFSTQMGSYQATRVDDETAYNLMPLNQFDDTEMLIELDTVSSGKRVFYKYNVNASGFNQGPTPCTELIFQYKIDPADTYIDGISSCDSYIWYSTGTTIEHYVKHLVLFNSYSGYGAYWGAGMGGNNTWNHDAFIYIR